MGSRELEQVASAVVTVATLAVGTVAAALLALALAGEVLGRAGRLPRVAARISGCTPVPLRRVAAVVVGVLAFAMPTPRAAADDSVRGWLHGALEPTTSTTSSAAPRSRERVSGGPHAPSAPGATTPPPEPAAPTSPSATTPPEAATAESVYVVQRGDCLWRIAARHLPGGSDVAIDHGWRAIYARNVVAVGPDPNLIHPGLVLSLPPLDPTP